MGDRGREWCSRLAWSALALTLWARASAAQPIAAPVDLAPEFASKIADAVAPATTIRLFLTSDEARTRADIERLLASRGVRAVAGGDGVEVRATCGRNLRERVCLAEVGRSGQSTLVTVARTLEPSARSVPEPIAVLALRPLYAQQSVMLDVAEVGNQLLVLTPDAIALVADAAGAARTVAAQTIRTSVTWPRDLRGMLHVSAVNAFEAHLPGVTCRGAVTPFSVTCADEGEAWPIGIENGGIGPSRNMFATSEGLRFYEAAARLDGWVVVGEQGTLTVLDSRRQVVARADAADHVVGLADGCGGNTAYVVTSVAGRGPDGSEALRLMRAAGDRLVPTASVVPLAGAMTSLWPAAAARGATAIVHDVAAGRYEAFHLSLSCAR